MEIPDPAVEIVISLPRRGKIRTLSPDDCDELIVAAARAKSMHLAALAALQPQEPPRDSHPYPDPAARATAESMPPGAANAICSHPGCGHPGSVHYLLSPHDHGCNQCEDQRYTAQRAITGAAIAAARTEATDGPVCNAGSPDGERFRCTRMPGHDSLHVALGSEGSDSEPVTWPQEPSAATAAANGRFAPEPAGLLATCGAASEAWTPCARLEGHSMPHRDENGRTWTDAPHDDGPEPYPATDGLQCTADDGPWHCTAQRGHGGPDHIAYAFGEIRHRWPVTPLDVPADAGGHYADDPVINADGSMA